MWNEFEHVEDGRFDPNRDGEHGEYREKNSDIFIALMKKRITRKTFQIKIQMRNLICSKKCILGGPHILTGKMN